jgi:hypothetical protein
LHLAVAITAPLAEALVEGRSGEAVVHVESESRDNCPPVHDHLVCPICRHIEARFAGASSPQRHLPQRVVRFQETFARETSEARQHFAGVLGARAPPFV